MGVKCVCECRVMCGSECVCNVCIVFVSFSVSVCVVCGGDACVGE